MNSKLISGVTEFLNTEEELREVIFKLVSAREAVSFLSREQGRRDKVSVAREVWMLSWSHRPMLQLGDTRMRSRLQRHLSAYRWCQEVGSAGTSLCLAGYVGLWVFFP